MFELYTGFHLAGPPLLRRPAVVLPDPDRPMDCASASDLEAGRIVPCSYAPLPESAGHADGVVSGPSSSASVLRLLLFSFLLLVTVGVALIGVSPPSSILRSTPSPLDHQLEWTRSTGVNSPLAVGRGVREGVSSKSSGAPVSSDAASDSTTSWSKEAFQWQRTGFHFQPERNWMNDPNAPMFYKGWYHLFYQYNPYSSVWGNMSWGHAVSRDLIHWLHLPLAMVRDHWYDAQGVFTGSATMLPDGTPVILYTGVTDQMYEVQNLAYPADPSDPLLLHWTKSPSNPILKAPAGVAPENFRDPMTAWYDPADGSWRVAIGAVDEHHEGFTLVFRTKDFLSYELLPGVLHSVPGTGMWECVDFFPVLANGSVEGLDLDGSAANGFGLKHVIKASLWDYMDDYYAIGTYDSMTGKWTPDDPAADVGTGLRYDYGKFYASKTFYDSEKRRRVLWGWAPETDSEAADLAKGWASLQGVPRTVRLDEKTGGANLVQWPVEEVESLRSTRWRFADVEVGPGQVVPLELHGDASQLDINVEFEIKKDALAATTLDADVGFNCSTSGGAADRGAVGPFGLLVLADEGLTEQTAIYFYILRGGDGQPRTFVCQDNLRSSLAKDLVKAVYGSTVPVLDGENLSLRILVDHSIVETFAQGGRTCITSRAYPTAAIGAAARVFLFNNGTAASVTAASVEIWQLESAFIKQYPLPLNASSGRANRSSPL